MFNLEPLLPHLPVWMLVMFRISGLFVFAPVLGSSAIPGRTKIMLILGLSLCVYPMLLAPGSPAVKNITGALDGGFSLWTIPAAVGWELAVGAAIGFCAMLPFIGLQIAGVATDQQLGLGLGGIYNPDLGDESGATGQFYYILASAIFLILGGHRVLFSIIVGTFGHIPLGGFRFDEGFVTMLLGLLSSAFELALRVAAPMLALAFVESLAMGFIARTVPQINIMSIGFALRILLGGSLLMVALSNKMTVFTESMWDALTKINHFFAAG